MILPVRDRLAQSDPLAPGRTHFGRTGPHAPPGRRLACLSRRLGADRSGTAEFRTDRCRRAQSSRADRRPQPPILSSTTVDRCQQFRRGSSVSTAYLGALMDGSAPPSKPPKSSDIAAEVCKLVPSPDPSAINFVFTSNAPSINYCPWHDTATCNGVTFQVANVPNQALLPGCSPCLKTNLSCSALSDGTLASAAGAHEFMEAIKPIPASTPGTTSAGLKSPTSAISIIKAASASPPVPGRSSPNGRTPPIAAGSNNKTVRSHTTALRSFSSPVAAATSGR